MTGFDSLPELPSVALLTLSFEVPGSFSILDLLAIRCDTRAWLCLLKDVWMNLALAYGWCITLSHLIFLVCEKALHTYGKSKHHQL